MSIRKDLAELVNENVISQKTSDDIGAYYSYKKVPSGNRLFVAFGILGAILVGLGIILILAHNWDQFSRTTKTIFAFLPLVIGQILCVFTLIKKSGSATWRERAAAFLFFAVGACISLVSQIYNISGDISSLILTWMLLCLPMVYILNSSIVSLFYLVGITYYACETGYWSHPSSEPWIFWLLLILPLPHYFLLYKQKSGSNSLIFHNWFIPISVVITLGTVAKSNEELMFIAYFSLFGLYVLLGHLPFFRQQLLPNNSYLVLGSLGTIVLLLVLSFDNIWEQVREQSFSFNEVITSPELLVSTILTLFAAGLLYKNWKEKSLDIASPTAIVFILFIPIFILGLYSPIPVFLTNIIVLGIGILMVRNGANQDHLGILNYGLTIITILVICRFFDTDLSFIIRGILFVAVGLGFFLTNYWMLKKRKANDQ